MVLPASGYVGMYTLVIWGSCPMRAHSMIPSAESRRAKRAIRKQTENLIAELLAVTTQFIKLDVDDEDVTVAMIIECPKALRSEIFPLDEDAESQADLEDRFALLFSQVFHAPTFVHRLLIHYAPYSEELAVI